MDPETLATTCRQVEWHRLGQGETLVKEGEDSDAAYIVVRGRLIASTVDSVDGSPMKVGEMGRGDVVGEIGLLGHTARSATVVAVRDSVVARLDEDSFLELVERQPRMMIQLALRAVARAEETRWHAAPNTVLAIVASEGSSVSTLVGGLEDELSRFGSVHRLSPEQVDAVLGTPGICDARRPRQQRQRTSTRPSTLPVEARGRIEHERV